MRYTIALVLACFVAPMLAQDKADDLPSNEKAQKTYKEALDYPPENAGCGP